MQDTQRAHGAAFEAAFDRAISADADILAKLRSEFPLLTITRHGIDYDDEMLLIAIDGILKAGRGKLECISVARRVLHGAAVQRAAAMARIHQFEPPKEGQHGDESEGDGTGSGRARIQRP